MIDYKYNAISLEILMKLYYLSKPVHCSIFIEEESLGLGEDLLPHLSLLKKKGFVENPVIFKVGKETPLFFKISDSGKKLIERILDNFPLTGD